MDKQCKNIRLNEDGSITFKTGRREFPENRVVKMTKTEVHFEIQGEALPKPLIVKMNRADYFDEFVWASRQTLDHLYPRGIVAYDNGTRHKSLPAKIMGTVKGQRVTYKDGDHLNLTRNNLVVVGANA
jgi:hypothetical protein